MPDEETSPLLSVDAHNMASNRLDDEAAEATPLLSSSTDTPRYDGQNDDPSNPDQDDSRPITPTKKKGRRWASLIAMITLAILIIVIIIVAFIVPDAVQEYAQKAAVVEPTNLSLESITGDGVQARVQANFRLDGSRVENPHVRRVGKAATWVASKLGIQKSKVSVYLPDYDNMLLGSATIPPLVINLRDGTVTNVDFITDITPGDVAGVRTIANDWLDGRLQLLRLNGKADLSARSGIIPLGTHTVSETLVFEATKIPSMPKYNISRLVVKDGPINGSMIASVSLSAFNEWPVQLDIPELAFDILVPGCHRHDSILVAQAVTHQVQVQPHADVVVDVEGIIRELPDALTRACPHSDSSPLDTLFDSFMHGDPTTLLVRGSKTPDGSTPQWIADILSSVTLPVPFPGRSLDGLIRNFTLTNTHFSMPDPSADPEDPASAPKVSGDILVTAAVPDEMNFGINVTGVRATSDVFYRKKKMGELNVKEWQAANSTRVDSKKDEDEALLEIQSRINDAPLKITDSDVFGEVLQALFFGHKQVDLAIHAAVDIQVVTTLGNLTVKGVPAEGKIPVKPLPKGGLESFAPKLGSVRILDSTTHAVKLEALVNVTNPTPYTAHVPYANVYIAHNGSVLGNVTAENLSISKGENPNVRIVAMWEPSLGGSSARQIGRDLLSQYLSGFNTTITAKAHRNTFPGQPVIGESLSRFNTTLDTPRMDLPGGTDEEKSHFIRDATFHLFSSTATFMLASPLEINTVYLDFINATALFNHTEPIGEILYDLPIAAPPGVTLTPKLPVSWSVGSVGYDAIKKALGGTLKLDAHAKVDVRLGNWQETIWYQGQGIGARVQW